MEFKRRLGIALIGSFALFGIANVMHFHRRVTCWDCFFPYGVPFTMYHEGGYAGGAGLALSGIAANVCLVVVLGTVVTLLWHYMPRGVR